LVAVVTTDTPGKNLPFVRGLTTKRASEVSEALESIIVEAEYVVGKKNIISRFHSDAGGEFMNGVIKNMLKKRDIFQTTTQGHDPKSNGLAERYIGIIKKRTTGYLVHASMPLVFWYWGALQAAYMYRSQVLAAPFPEGCPTFGNRVLVRCIDGEKKSFKPKSEEGIFLSWDAGTIQGAYVAVPNPTKGITIVRASAPVPWPDQEFETWKVVNNPLNESEKVWLSNKSRIKWSTPGDGETPTFEERTWPEQYEPLADIWDEARRLETRPEKDWRRFRHGVVTKDTVEEERLNIKRSHYDYPDEEGDPEQKEVDEKEGPEESTDATGRPTVLEEPPVLEDAKCGMDLRPFCDDEDSVVPSTPDVLKGKRCVIDMNPFDDRVDFDEELQEGAEVNVCNVKTPKLTVADNQASAETYRTICEDRAEEVLMRCEDEERIPATQDIEYILELWVGHQNKHRGKAMPKDKAAVESDAFGLVKSLSCIDPIIARNTRSYPCIVMAINLWMKSQCIEKNSFSWSTFTINRGWMSERHRDTNNVGPSAIVSFGRHRGGELRWWPNDYPGGVLGKLQNDQSELVDPFHQVCYFNGTKAHETCHFEGNRVSLIFYELKWDAKTDVKADLRVHGFTSYGLRVQPKKSKKENPKIQINAIAVGQAENQEEPEFLKMDQGKYIIGSKAMADEENEDEDESYDLTPFFADEPGAELMSLSEIKRLDGEDLEVWRKAMQDEIDSLQSLNVYEELTKEEVHERYWGQKIRTKTVPGKLVATKKPLFDDQGGWKAKARICSCGNFEPDTKAKDLSNRAEVPATFEMRMLLALSQIKGWDIGSLDIKTAFLHAPLSDQEDGIYLVKPPEILVRMGLIKEGAYWKLRKVLYGLRSGPKKWGDHRDRALQDMRIRVKGETGTLEANCEPGKHCANIWKILEGKKIVGYFLIYVDDVLIVGPRLWLNGTIEAFQEKWECKVSGIISNPKLQIPGDERIVESLHFLGLVLEYQEECLVVHQTQYIVARLQKRGLLKGTCRMTLPQVAEGKLAPEDRNTQEYQLALDKCRIEVGALQWLAQKSRPDIAAITSIAASIQSKTPTEGLRLAAGIWKYLAATWSLAMRVEPASGCPVLVQASNQKNSPSVPKLPYHLDIYTDASLAPGGDRSRTGIVIAMNGYIVHWISKRQGLAATSSCEAELNGSFLGLKTGIGLRALVAELVDEGEAEMRMFGDNEAALTTLMTQVTSWRTRHYAIRASWLRDAIVTEECALHHVAGKQLVSDALTKVLERTKLSEARERLQLVVWNRE